MLAAFSQLAQEFKRKLFKYDDDEDDEYEDYLQEQFHKYGMSAMPKSEHEKICHPYHHCDTHNCVIRDTARADDVARFIEKLDRKNRKIDPPGQKPSWTFHTEHLRTFIYSNSVRCVTTVVNHVDFNESDLLVGLPPLHMAVSILSLPMVELFLKHNAPTDLRSSKFDWKAHYQMLPLNYSLHALRNFLISFKLWTPEQSVYKMLIILCLPQLRSKLEIVRLLAQKTNKLGEEIYYYSKNGRLFELAVLLLVAQEKVTPTSFIEIPLKIPQSRNGSSNMYHCMTLREFIISELALLSALQVKLELCGENGKLSSSCKEKQSLMKSALLLLEVFKRAGKSIESCLHNQMPQQELVEKVSRTLEEVGFSLEDKDTDMSHVDSCPWPEFCHMDHIRVAGENGIEFYQLGDPTYASLRENPILELQRSNGMQYKEIDFKPDPSLDKDLESLCENEHLIDWSSLESVFVLLFELRSQESRKLLLTIKSHLDKTKEIEELVCYYAREGRVTKVAALLMVAWKELVVLDSFESGSGSSCGRSKIRQFLMSEIEKLTDKEEMQQLCKPHELHTDKGNISSIKISTDKEKLLSALRLLEIFERSGHHLDVFETSDDHLIEVIKSGGYSEMTLRDLEEAACLLSNPNIALNLEGTTQKCADGLSKGKGEGQSDMSVGQDNCIYKGDLQIIYPLKENLGNGITQRSKGILASAGYCSASQHFHTSSVSRSSFALNPSLPVRTEVHWPMKRLEPRVLKISSSSKWASIAVSVGRVLKHV